MHYFIVVAQGRSIFAAISTFECGQWYRSTNSESTMLVETQKKFAARSRYRHFYVVDHFCTKYTKNVSNECIVLGWIYIQDTFFVFRMNTQHTHRVFTLWHTVQSTRIHSDRRVVVHFAVKCFIPKHLEMAKQLIGKVSGETNTYKTLDSRQKLIQCDQIGPNLFSLG